MVVSDTTNLTQKLIIGNYVRGEKIGEGGFGKVYKAKHRSLEKYACIKIIQTEQTKSDDNDLIFHEASILNQLNHKNIIQLIDLHIGDDQITIIMDYVDGGDLASLLKEVGGPLPVTQVDGIIQQIAEGLHHAHQKQIIHRDLKPQNILLHKDGRIVIADFGIAKMMDTTRSQFAQLGNAGTAQYMAPEHCEGKPGYASDLYSLGVIAYRLLTYHLPFTGSFEEIREDHRRHKLPPPLRSFNATLSPEIEQVVLKMLAKEPQERYPSPLEFARALHAAITKMTLNISNVNPENIHDALLSLHDDQVISLDPGDYQGPLTIQKRIRLIGAGLSTRIYTIDEPVLHICASGVQLEHMLIQRTRQDNEEPVIQAEEDVSYELRNVSIQGGTLERGSWRGSEWQLPVEGIDLGDIPIESVQERAVSIEVKDWCTIETNLQGLEVFPLRLSPGPHILKLAFRAGGRPPGTRLTGIISLLSENGGERKEIRITGQIESQLSIASSPIPTPPPLTPMKWLYQLRDEAARSLLRELGSDEEKDQARRSIRNYRLNQEMKKRASDLLFDLIGKNPICWYIRRKKVDLENQGNEAWTLTLAVDSSEVDDLRDPLRSLLKQRKTMRLSCDVNVESRGKIYVRSINFPGVEEGIKDLTVLPALIQLATYVPEYKGISQELLARIQELPVESKHELDRDQLKTWELWLQVQKEQINRQQYQAKYINHTYREDVATIVFTLDKENIRNAESELIPYQEFQVLARNARRERLRLLTSLPEKGSPQRKRGQDIGTQERFHPEKGTLTIRLDPTIAANIKNGSYALPTSGYLCFDAAGDAVQIDRQREAMDDLKQGKTVNRLLPDFFFDTTKARFPKELRRLQPSDLLSGTCNSAQIAAIEAALNTPDLLLIQGPPGTGKTTVIAEICYQIARSGGRTLIASQSNLAVDNALGRIIHHPSIRALRKGNPDSIEEEGRDFTDERVVEKWLKNTALDCQAKKERRTETITRLKKLLISSQRFSLYREREIEWGKQQLSLQRTLDIIKWNLEEIEGRIIQGEQDEQRYVRISNTFSSVLAGSADGSSSINQEAFQLAFQYLAKTIVLPTFIKNINESLQIMKQVGLTPPATFSLLEYVVWLKKQAHTYNQTWTKSVNNIIQINTVIAVQSDAQERQRQIAEALQQREARLNDLAAQIRTMQTALWKQASALQQLQNAWNRWHARSDSNKADIVTRLTKWIEYEIQNQLTSGNRSSGLEMDVLLSEDMISVIQVDPARVFFNEWDFFKKKIEQYILKVIVDIQTCNQIQSRLPLLYAAMNQELSALPEVKQALEQVQPVQYTMPKDHTAFSGLVQRMEDDLEKVREIRLQSSSLVHLLFKDRGKQQLYNLFREIRNLWITIQGSRDHIVKLLRNDIAEFAGRVAQRLTDSLAKWYMTRRASIERQINALDKEQLEKEHQSVQDLYQQEKNQLSSMQDELRKCEKELIDHFRDLSQCEAIPEEIREVARQNVVHKAQHIGQYQDISQRWMADIQSLGTLVPAIWEELERATEEIQRQLQQTRIMLEEQKQQRGKLKLEQKEQLETLQHEPDGLIEDRSWWRNLWEAIPEDLRPQASTDNIFSLPLLEEVQQQFEIWERELAKEEHFAQRYDGLIADWVMVLQNLSESDKLGLRDEYIKNANVVGITCNQVYKFNRREMRQFSTFDVVIIDEASKASPPEILLPAIKGKKLIIIGDRHQLPPMVDDKTFDQILDENGQDVSAFEDLNKSYFADRYNEAPDEIKRMLHIQYRMHPDIMAAINQFYERPLECGLSQPDVQRDHQLESRMIGKNKHIIWLNTPLVSARERNGRSQRISARNVRSGHEVLAYQSEFTSFREEANGTSLVNSREAEIILKTCQELNNIWMPKKRAGAKPKDIGIITFYAAQEKLLRNKLNVSRTGTSANFAALNIRIGTVDRFQGMERAVIIVSMVRNNGHGDIGFAKKDERINVAFSRSQQLLIIVGCHDLFCVTASGEQAVERYKNVARIVRNRGDFIDVSCL